MNRTLVIQPGVLLALFLAYLGLLAALYLFGLNSVG